MTIDKEGCSKKISNRVYEVRQTINKLKSFPWSNNVRKQVKYRLYGKIQRILFYEAETWKTTQRDKQRLEAVQIDFLRTIFKASRLDWIKFQIKGLKK